jgi:hypothetical protein
MKKSRFSESQIVAALKEGEAGVPVADILTKARDQSSDVLHVEVEVRGRERQGSHPAQGVGAGDREAEAPVRRVRPGERGDQGRTRPNVVTPSAKRQPVGLLTAAHGLSVQRACRAVRWSRAAYYRPPPVPSRADDAVIDALQQVVTSRPRWGFWRCFDHLRWTGQPGNHKRVHRVYCALRLNLPRRMRRRRSRETAHPLQAPPRLNHTWAVDFMTDTLYNGRRFRTLNVLDEGNREGLGPRWTPKSGHQWRPENRPQQRVS